MIDVDLTHALAVQSNKRCLCSWSSYRTPENRCEHCGLPISGKLLRAERKRGRYLANRAARRNDRRTEVGRLQ